MKDSRTLENLIAKHAKEEFSIASKFSNDEKERLKERLRAS